MSEDDRGSGVFEDRVHAGALLSEIIQARNPPPEALVVGLPRGGVVVAGAVARRLGLELRVLAVRKLGVPGRSELAMGALAPGGIQYLNEKLIRYFGIRDTEIHFAVKKATREIARLDREFNKDAAVKNFRGRHLILVDDGIATGATMQVAVRALRKEKAARIWVAVPVLSFSALPEFRRLVDQVIFIESPRELRSVGRWYHNFTQTTYAEARQWTTAPLLLSIKGGD